MLVIGNGESRKTINLDSLTTTKIGCNAIYRDNNVEHLVCVDKPMFKEVLKANRNDKAAFLYLAKCLKHKQGDPLLVNV